MTDSLSVSAASAALCPTPSTKRRTAYLAFVALLAAFSVFAPFAAGAAAPPPPPASAQMTVIRVIAGRVDIDVPGLRRPPVGTRLIVQREGSPIAELEVTILRERQASCRIVSMTAPIASGDLVLRPPTAKAAASSSGAGGGAAEAANQTMIVQRVLRGAVDISLVASQPVAVGDRLVVERGSLVIGELEVVLIGEHSATCRIDREVRPITQGDRVRRLDVPAQPPAETPVAPPAAPAPAPAPVVEPTPEAPPAPAGEVAPQPVPPAEAAPAVTATETAPAQPIRVRQVLAEEVFLDAGRTSGLAVGQRLKVVHTDEASGATSEVAELEIAFIAGHSASCRIVATPGSITVGDLAIPGPAPAPAAPAPSSGGASGKGSGATATTSRGRPPGWDPAEHTDYSGSLALRFQGFQDGSEAGRDFYQESALVNIYAGHIGGSKFDFRLRGTASREQIQLSSGGTESRDNDRLYEATLSYEPPEARFTYQVGRLISGPLVGFDYLDGGVGEFHATRRFSLGAFYGSRSNGDQIDFASTGRAYGAFVHWLDQTPGSPFYAEFLLEAIGDYLKGETNREYLSFYGRQGSGSRWSLYERAEFDLGRNWRDNPTANDSQLSNVLFSGSYSLNKAVRLGVSYDQSRQILTLDDRFTPEELFDNALREGYRVTAYLGSAKTVRGNFSVGQRWKQGNPDRSLAYNANVYHSNVLGWNMLIGADYSGFDGDTSSGFRAGLRIQKYFRSGHDVELTVGTSGTDLVATGENRKNQWLRLSGTLQLGRRFYLLGELESATGDDLEGERLFLQLGYRL
jgi:hypothetical protein